MFPSKQIIRTITDKTIVIISSYCNKITINGTKMINVFLDNSKEHIEQEHIKQKLQSFLSQSNLKK
jgi:hypothetical protein